MMMDEVKKILNLNMLKNVDLFEIRELEGKGRGVIAKTDIAMGTIILEERCSLWRCSSSACIHCFSEDHSLFQCQRFQQNHPELHKFAQSCNKTQSEKTIQSICSQLLFDASEVAQKFVKPIVFSLYGNERISQRELNLIAEMYESAPEKYKIGGKENFLKLFKILENNAHEMKSADGMGLFPLVSMLNHQCVNSNCSYQSSSLTNMVVKTLRDIKKGEELTVSYISSFISLSFRKRVLRARYDFDCKCENCVDCYDYARCFKCEKCKKGLLIVKNRGDLDR